MRPITLRLFAASSLLLGSAVAATRPHYGGTLRVLVRPAAGRLDPGELAATVAGRNISRLIFDTLVTLDDRGISLPGLATSWQSDAGNQSWQFWLRPGITFSDGSPLTADGVASSLRADNPAWHIVAGGESVAIKLDSPDVDLPAELASVRNAIVRRDGGKLSGTGPFTVSEWQTGKKLTLTARPDYWNGRPFLGAVEIDLGADSRAVDFRRYQLAEIAPEQARRAANSRIEISAPSELWALLFAREPASEEEGRLRSGLSLSIDRKVIGEALLQSGGEPARGLLPGWMTGYDFLFSSDTNLPLARQAVGDARQKASWSLGYEARDPLARLMAERIALNANDAGIKLVPTTVGPVDVRLVGLSLASLDPHVALANLAASAGLASPRFSGNSSEALYGAERALLQTQRIVPLVHVKAAVVLAGSINNWTSSRDSDWHLADVWLGAEKP